jgi:hypothetical protein
VEDALGGCFVQSPGGRRTDLFGGVHLLGSQSLSEFPNRSSKLRLHRPVFVTTHQTLSQSLFGSRGIWHLKNLLHYWQTIVLGGRIMPKA